MFVAVTLSAGARIGRYEIAACIGSGGMGEVYRALDTMLQRTVAVKLLLPGRARGRQALEKEARAIAAVSHPHIGALYDVGEHDGQLFLVMELVEGETLAVRLRRGPLTVADAVRIALDLAGALEAAHRHDVVHRDLKPSNVVLTRSGAKLVDFGIAALS